MSDLTETSAAVGTPLRRQCKALGEQVRPAVQVHTQALAATQKVLADMLRIGLSAEALRAAKERPSREQAEVLQRVIDGLLGGLDLSAEQRARVPAALADVLTREGLL